MLNREAPDGGNLTERLIQFADFVGDSSPLYARVCRGVASDPTVLEILGEARHGQPAANILLAAVQYLLLGGVDHPLGDHYRGTAAADPVPAFLDFCRAHRSELKALVGTRTVQTNEVRRCTSLLPALSMIALHDDRAIGLIEVGPSTGLNLLLDRYHYDYGGGVEWGDPASPVRLTTEVRPTGRTMPLADLTIAWHRGIDLDPLDVTDPDHVRWARALLWPEQTERIARFEAAVAVARTNPPFLVRGDALVVLPDQITSAPADTSLVVVHSFVINQFTDTERARLGDLLAHASERRVIDRIGIEMLSRGADHPEIVHTRYERGSSTTTRLGSCHHHGEWLAWER